MDESKGSTNDDSENNSSNVDGEAEISPDKIQELASMVDQSLLDQREEELEVLARIKYLRERLSEKLKEENTVEQEMTELDELVTLKISDMKKILEEDELLLKKAENSDPENLQEIDEIKSQQSMHLQQYLDLEQDCQPHLQAELKAARSRIQEVISSLEKIPEIKTNDLANYSADEMEYFQELAIKTFESLRGYEDDGETMTNEE